MKFSLAAILLLATSTEAVKVQSQQQMQAEIQAMSMNANMHQVSVREKTLLKTYLQVDMNEFLQQKMDSELFAGVNEQQKSQFIGNFFHFVKCRFQDCALVQTNSELNMAKGSEAASPTGAESKKREDIINVENWGRQGNNAVAHSKDDKVYLAQTQSPTGAETKKREDIINLENWGRQGNNAVAHSKDDKVALAQKEKIVTNTFKEVQKDLKKQELKELVVPTALADSAKDAAPEAKK